jgi:ABC-type antimicrobial peptide transport system permease subunit
MGWSGEIGVRMAPGALPETVLRIVLMESLLLCAARRVAGILLALGMGNLLRSQLYQMNFAGSAASSLYLRPPR